MRQMRCSSMRQRQRAMTCCRHVRPKSFDQIPILQLGISPTVYLEISCGESVGADVVEKQLRDLKISPRICGMHSWSLGRGSGYSALAFKLQSGSVHRWTH